MQNTMEQSRILPFVDVYDALQVPFSSSITTSLNESLKGRVEW